MKLGKSKLSTGLVIFVALLAVTCFVLMAQQAKTEKPERAFPSTGVSPAEPLSPALTSSGTPPVPDKPEEPVHMEPAPKLATSARGAYPMSITAAAKPEKIEGYRPPGRSLEGIPKQEGGETCDDAYAVTLPFNSTGYTCDNVDDYDEECPYSGSTSPDVVYSYTPSADQCIDIDLGGSAYDTKVFVYEDVCASPYYACNDDYYPDYTSAIFGLDIYAGHTYYIVVDGYGGDCGDYLISVSECVECDVVCPPGGVLEGEPICYDGYVDNYNGGCNVTPLNFQPINCGDTICGTSGVYDAGGYREMDWFSIELTSPATLTWSAVAEFPVALWILDAGSQDCSDPVTLNFNYTYVLCDTLSISADVPAGVYWFIIAPPDWGDYPCGVEYVAWLDCEEVTTGACCYDFDPYTCTIETPEDCAAMPDHTFKGLGTDCDPNPCLPAPDNDSCQNAIQIYPPDCPAVQTVSGTTIGATVDCPGVLDWDAVWYKFELTYDCNNVSIDYCPTNLPDVYTRGVVLYDECQPDCPNYILYTGLSWVTCSSGYTDLTVWWNGLPPGTYWLPVYVHDSGDNPMDFTFDICVEECVVTPGDNCSDPITVSIPAELPYTNTNYTCGRLDDYENTCLGSYDGGEDIIYEVTVTTDVCVDIVLDPKGTTWTGVAIDVACPPGDPCLAYHTQSGGTAHGIYGLDLTAGTYYIMVDTWPSPDCIPDFDLTITECSGGPENDDCADATPIGDVTELPFSTTQATFDGPGGCQTAPNIWYCYTATCDGNAHIALCGSEYDTKLAVYDGCTCDPIGTMLGCNDDACYGKALQSELTIPVVDGNQYLIEVGGYSSNTGDGVLTCSCYVTGGGPANDDCEDAIVLDPPECPATLVVDGTTIDANIDCPGVLDWPAVWYTFTLTTESHVFIDFCEMDIELYSVGAVIFDECPPDCPNYILYSEGAFITCPSGLSNAQLWYRNLPAGQYWLPIYVEDYGGNMYMDFSFGICIEEAYPCDVVCPPFGIPENEPICEDDWEDIWNGGCNSAGPPYPFEDVLCGDTICGTSGTYLYYGSNYRDTDWFRVEVGDGDLTYSCVAEFPLLIFLIDAGSENCLDYTILTYVTAYECDTAVISQYVPQGVYWLWVGPSVFSGVPCGKEYVMWVDCVPFGAQVSVNPGSMYPVLNPTGACSSATENLLIASVGGEDLDYEVTEDPPVAWMDISPTSGTLPPGVTDTLDVSFDAGGMAPGDYYSDIVVASNAAGKQLDDTVRVTVHLEVELAPEIDIPPRLWMPVVPGCMMDQGFRIVNLGEGELDFEISVTQNPPPAAAGKSNIREALETLRQAGMSNPDLTPREAYKTLGAKRSAAQFQSTGTSENLLVPAGGGKQATILLVDDDGGLPGGTYTDVEQAYIDALDANGYVYDYYVVDWTDPLADGPDLATMQNYSCIIWFCGETWGYYGDDTITDDDEVNLAAFLDGGGNLFLSSQDYLYESYPSAGALSPGQFPYDYLGVSYAYQDAWTDPYTVYGGAGSVADGMQFDALRCYNDPNVPLWTDVILGQGSYLDVLLVDGIDPTAIQYDGGTFKTVFTTTAFCGLVDGSPSLRADLMASIMEWMGCVGAACPFVVAPESGTVPAESFFDVFLTFDGTLFTECVDDTLTCYLVITSNDCDEPMLTVDVHAMSARGDVNADCGINVEDVVYLLNYFFVSGPAPDPMCIGDVDRDGDVDSDDVLYLISYLFLFGPPPEVPTAPMEGETIDIKTIRPINQTPLQRK